MALYVARTVVGLTFILSGFVKAIDPLGTQYKIQDYLAAIPPSLSLPDMLTLLMSVSLSMVEFTLGAFMLTAISRRVTARLTLLFMVVMTAVTVWIYIADPVKDCGCFGDALTLTNLETLLKNIVLLALAALVAWRPTHIGRLMSRSNQMLLGQMMMLTPVALSFWCLYDLPLIDFRQVKADFLERLAKTPSYHYPDPFAEELRAALASQIHVPETELSLSITLLRSFLIPPNGLLIILFYALTSLIHPTEH